MEILRILVQRIKSIFNECKTDGSCGFTKVRSLIDGWRGHGFNLIRTFWQHQSEKWCWRWVKGLFHLSLSWCKESLLLHILIQSLLFAQKKHEQRICICSCASPGHLAITHALQQLPASQIRHHLPTQNLVVVTKQAAKDSLIPTGQIKANN
jgi:hypothetical protein